MTPYPLIPYTAVRDFSGVYLRHNAVQTVEEYHIEVPIITWHARPFLRISVQAYNTREDIARLRDALVSLFVLRDMADEIR